jgi:hypothetical protein
VSAIALIAAARTLVLALEQRPFFTFEARGDGSLRTQGRPAESLCETTSASTRGSIQSNAIPLSPVERGRIARAIRVRSYGLSIARTSPEVWLKITTENCPTGKSVKTCPAPFAKIFRLTRRANHLYKLAPSHPMRGGSRVVTNARWDAMDATASGAQYDRRAGLPVSDRPVRGRTTLLTVFARTCRTARGPARPLA